MATTTTRFGMRKPDPTDTYNVTLDQSNNWDLIDVDLGSRTCTSATRPSHVAGRLIRETDTGKVYISDGTNWRQIATDNTAFTSTAAGTFDDLSVTDDLTIGDDVTLATGSVLTWAGDTTLQRGGAGILTINGDLQVAAQSVSRGMVAYHKRTTSSTGTTATTQATAQKVIELSAAVKSGRHYRVHVFGHAMATAYGVSEMGLVHTINGTTPAVTSTALNRCIIEQSNTSVPLMFTMSTGFIPASDHTLKVLLTQFRASGTGTHTVEASSTAPLEMWIEDAGIAASSGTNH